MPLLDSHAEPGERRSLMAKKPNHCILELFGEIAAVVSVILYVFSLWLQRSVEIIREFMTD